MNVREMRALLRSGDLGARQFEILRSIASLVNEPNGESEGREILIRVLEQREHFEPYGEMLNGLLSVYGLFPYMSPDEMGVADALAYEFHRPLDYDRGDVVMHKVQADVYRKLLDGESVILSAPTSFGKSLILDTVAASRRLNNIAVVVPTLALIDETRRRLARLRDHYKIVTHPSQSAAARNIYVMTQERLLEVEDLPRLDLFMIDEFYKLDSGSDGDGHRSILLNQALHSLMSRSRAFYLAGPNVKELSEALPPEFSASFIATDFATVTSNLRILPKPAKGQELDALLEICRSVEGPTLIYCSSPEKTRRVALALLENGLGEPSPRLTEAARWVAEDYHEEWLVGRALAGGVGIHHARLPRWLAQYTVDAFNDGHLQYMACTSTLIEGVNTSAKNVIMFDHKIGKNRNLDYFTFANIAGRSGRMRRHYVGEVIVFREPPTEELPIVDMPVYSQGPDTPTSLLIQLDPDELTAQSRERVRRLTAESLLPIEVLKNSRAVPPEAQISLARAIDAGFAYSSRSLGWSRFPTYDQLKASCEAVVTHLRPISGREYGVSSGSQLAFKLNLAAVTNGDVKELIANELASGPQKVRDNPDAAVEETLAFLRQWVGFEVPRLLATLQSVFNAVAERNGSVLRANYAPYLARCEALFLPPHVAALDEFGLPPRVVRALSGLLPNANDGLDPLLSSLRAIDAGTLFLGAAERSLLRSVQDSI